MAWWEFEPERKPPFAPAEYSGRGDVRWPFAALALMVGVLSVGALVAALIFRAPDVSAWSVASIIVCAVLARVLTR